MANWHRFNGRRDAPRESGDGSPPNDPPPADRYKKTFEVRLPNVRLWAFVLTAAVVVLFLILPLALRPHRLVFPNGQSCSSAEARPEKYDIRDYAALTWNIGRMSSAHGAFGTDCNACHETPFVPVQSAQCLKCHEGIQQHADLRHVIPEKLARVDLAQQRCESCHREHKGMTIATRDSQSDCVACHGRLTDFIDIQGYVAEGRRPRFVKNRTDFGVDHDDFHPALVQDAAARLQVHYEPGDQDHGNVAFTHRVHFFGVAQGLKELRDKHPEQHCDLCHLPAPDGAGFRVVTYEQHCDNCHTLRFEPSKDWKLPHGHPEEIASRIAGYYADATLRGEDLFNRPAKDVLPKPGEPMPQAKPLDRLTAVDRTTAAILMCRIAPSTCGECHVEKPKSDQCELGSAWEMPPVFVPDRYFPEANFRHDKHATTGCTYCHVLEDQSDPDPNHHHRPETEIGLLLPKITVCRNCHSGQASPVQRVASTCITCHGFHDKTLSPVAPAAAASACPALREPSAMASDAK